MSERYIMQIRKARKDYRCPSEWAHDPTVRKGELYARVKRPPIMGAYSWTEQAYHVECWGDDL